jgi:phage tail-like protein
VTDKYQFILHIQGPDIKQDLDLQVGSTTIGREAGNTLLLSNPLISRHHARFDCTDIQCAIVDLNSANGTFLNGVKIPPQVPIPVESNALIKIGPVEINLEAVKQEERIEPIEVPKVKDKPLKQVDSSLQTKGLPPEPEIKDEKKESFSAQQQAPPPANPPPLPIPLPEPEREEKIPPPGLSIYSTRLLNYLPGIYHDDFMSRFLALFESILFPIEWNIDNFDLFLDPGTAPSEFLPWLMNWFEISFNSTWSEEQRRKLLKGANQIYARRGTRWALSRVLEIYLGQPPDIIENSDGQNPYTFKVKIPLPGNNVNQELIEQLINSNKPAYTAYSIEYSDQK